ncbi:MAG: helix-turn-helix transcriptional regulator [Eubacteriales bacterium]|nr:helix-turn-helix transcriptional regulator [Eubacteriales bacterium]
MYEIFKQLCDEMGITPYRFCKDTGINSSTISTWKSKNKPCSFKLADAISRYFHVSIDYLMTGREKTRPDRSPREEQSRDIKKKYEEIHALLKSRESQPLFFDGKPADEESIDLLLKQVEISLALIDRDRRLKTIHHKEN